MANIRPLPWLTSLRDLRSERIVGSLIREERLRATALLREPDSLTSWRGRSGRRYVVGVHAPTEPDLADIADAVVIAVRRGRDGTAAVVDAAAPGRWTPRPARAGWLSAARRQGATELHVHRLADSEAARRAVVADLVEDRAGRA